MDLTERKASNIGERVGDSVMLLWATNMLMRAMQLVTTALLARLLTPNDYGLIALATTIVGFVDLTSNLQTSGAILRIQNITTEHLGSAFTINLIRGITMVLAMVLLAQPLADYMNEGRLAGVLYALAPSVLMGCLHNPCFLLLARNLDYRKESKRNAIAAVGGSVAGIVMAIMAPSYWALVVGSLCTNFISMGLSYWKVPGLPRLNLKKSAEFISYGGSLILINIMEYVNSKVDYLLIGNGLGNRSLGAYHLGQQVTTMATGDIVAPLNQALMPAFSIIASDPIRLRDSYQRVQSLMLAIALPIGFGVSLLAEDIIFLLVGKQWELAIPVIHFLAPLIALQTIIASIESLALSTNNGRLLVLRTFIFLFVRIVLMFIGYYMGGFMGIIYARMISGSFFLLYGLALAAKITRSHWLDPIIVSWRSFVSVATMCLVLYIAQHFMIGANAAAEPAHKLVLPLVVKIFAGGLTYVSTHLLLWKIVGVPDGAEQKLLVLARRFTAKLATQCRQIQRFLHIHRSK